MPILYIHGVNTRSRQGFSEYVLPYLRRIVAPAISNDPESVLIDDAFWGDLGIVLEWNGVSRPKSLLLGQGAQEIDITPLEGALTATTFTASLRQLPSSTDLASTGGLISSGSTLNSEMDIPLRLRELSNDELSDLLAVVITQELQETGEYTALILAADRVVCNPATRTALETAEDAEEELDYLLNRIREQVEADLSLIGQGAADWVDDIRDRLEEVVQRSLSAPVYAISVVTAEIRKPLNELFSLFLGDVFKYLDKRLDRDGTSEKPGQIPQLFLNKLEEAHSNKQSRNGEPLIVLSHSMGGQIVYDAITHFLPMQSDLKDIHIDFWCATASQVGFFEEAKLFCASQSMYKTGNPVPFPQKHLGVWWNVWDHNDFISFTTKGIIDKVDDEPYDSGMTLLDAHGGYLKRPSFYRKFAQKIHDAKAKNWKTV